MKTEKIKWGLAAAMIIPILMGCPRREIKAPEPDTELQSAVDASFATFVISDIDMISSFALGGDDNIKFYNETEGENPVNIVGNIQNETLRAVNFYNTRCVDGRSRNGTVVVQFPNTNPNARYYHRHEFHGQVSLSAYRVGDWLVKTVDGLPCHIYNLMPSPTATAGPLSWSIEGSFEFTHATDASRNMVWTGKVTKTLVNSGDRTVYDPSRQVAIDWSKARVEYKGSASGVTSANVPFTFKINDEMPITRDFSCYPDPVGGVITTPTFRAWTQEFHPFSKGVATFTTADKYPRQIYYGNEGHTDLPVQCDNSGEILIKGNSYKVDFMK